MGPKASSTAAPPAGAAISAGDGAARAGAGGKMPLRARGAAQPHYGLEEGIRGPRGKGGHKGSGGASGGFRGAASGHSFASLAWTLSTATAALKFPAIMAPGNRPLLRFRNGSGPGTLTRERPPHRAANIWNEIQTYRL